MNRPEIETLRADIAAEWRSVERAIEDVRHMPSESPSPLDIRGAASILHDFYSGIESIFVRIAQAIDGSLPQGADWHAALLQRMAQPILGLRPAVIEEALAEATGEFLRFRHLFRHSYGFRLRWDRIQPLLRQMPDVQREVERSLREFDAFLATL